MEEMFQNQFKINLTTSKCKCNCNCNTMNFRMKILIAFILILYIVMLLFGITYVAGSKLYLEMSKRQEQALQVAQEELYGLKVQMQFVLQSTHKKQISNRSQQRSAYYHSSNSIKSIIHKFSNSSPGRYKRDAEISTSKPYYDTATAILPFAPNQTMNDQKNMLEKNISAILNNTMISSEKFGSNLIHKKQNSPRARNANVKTENHKMMKNDMSGSGALQSSRRNQREEKKRERKEKRRHNRGRSNHNCTQSGPLVATFVGAEPNHRSTNKGYIEPWINIDQRNKQFEFKKFYLREKNMIEINLSGLYMIFAQIYYEGSEINHAYLIFLISEGGKEQQLSKCAVASAAAGASCHTSVVAYLQKNDRLIIKQAQGDRYINLGQGFSQVQLVLLSEEKTSNIE